MKRQTQTVEISYSIPEGLFWTIPSYEIADALEAYIRSVRYPQLENLDVRDAS